MYRDELDATHLFYVCRFTPGGDVDEDYRRHLEGMRSAIAAASETPAELTIMIVQDPGYPLPGPNVRKAVAEMTSPVSFKAITAVVTKNALMRGVHTAMNWLRPKHYAEEVWPDASTAIAWLEREKKRPLPHVRAAASRLGLDAGPA